METETKAAHTYAEGRKDMVCVCVCVRVYACVWRMGKERKRGRVCFEATERKGKHTATASPLLTHTHTHTIHTHTAAAA